MLYDVNLMIRVEAFDIVRNENKYAERYSLQSKRCTLLQTGEINFLMYLEREREIYIVLRIYYSFRDKPHQHFSSAEKNIFCTIEVDEK